MILDVKDCVVCGMQINRIGLDGMQFFVGCRRDAEYSSLKRYAPQR